MIRAAHQGPATLKIKGTTLQVSVWPNSLHFPRTKDAIFARNTLAEDSNPVTTSNFLIF
jgi:hypothetical protein